MFLGEECFVGEGEEGMLCEGGTLLKKGPSPTPPPPKTLIVSYRTTKSLLI